MPNMGEHIFGHIFGQCDSTTGFLVLTILIHFVAHAYLVLSTTTGTACFKQKVIFVMRNLFFAGGVVGRETKICP